MKGEGCGVRGEGGEDENVLLGMWMELCYGWGVCTNWNGLNAAVDWGFCFIGGDMNEKSFLGGIEVRHALLFKYQNRETLIIKRITIK